MRHAASNVQSLIRAKGTFHFKCFMTKSMIIFVSSDGLRPLNNLIVNIGQQNGYYRRLHVSNKSSEMPRLGTGTVTLL